MTQERSISKWHVGFAAVAGAAAMLCWSVLPGYSQTGKGQEAAATPAPSVASAWTRSSVPAPWEPSTPAETALLSVDEAEGAILCNIANSETQCYKRLRVKWIGGGKVEIGNDFSVGTPKATGKSTDVAIDGDGFFRVHTKLTIGGGIAYTRNGNFFVNPTGELVLGRGDGYPLDPPIVIPKGVPEKDIVISSSGEVMVKLSGEPTSRKIGQIFLWHFANNDGLAFPSDVLFFETERSGAAMSSTPGSENGGTQLISNFLEGSNVDPRREEIELHRIRALQTRLEKLMR